MRLIIGQPCRVNGLLRTYVHFGSYRLDELRNKTCDFVLGYLDIMGNGYIIQTNAEAFFFWEL
jgi:hypothetical protein